MLPQCGCCRHSSPAPWGGGACQGGSFSWLIHDPAQARGDEGKGGAWLWAKLRAVLVVPVTRLCAWHTGMLGLEQLSRMGPVLCGLLIWPSAEANPAVQNTHGLDRALQADAGLAKMHAHLVQDDVRQSHTTLSGLGPFTTIDMFTATQAW